MTKTPRAEENPAGGYDLRVERDSGNEVLILTGRPDLSVEFWRELRRTCDSVLFNLKAEGKIDDYF